MPDVAAAPPAPESENNIRKIELNEAMSGPNLRSFTITDKNGKAKVYSWPVNFDASEDVIRRLDEEVMDMVGGRDEYMDLPALCTLMTAIVDSVHLWPNLGTARLNTLDSIKEEMAAIHDRVKVARTASIPSGNIPETTKTNQGVEQALESIDRANKHLGCFLDADTLSPDIVLTDNMRDEWVPICGRLAFLGDVVDDLYEANLLV